MISQHHAVGFICYPVLHVHSFNLTPIEQYVYAVLLKDGTCCGIWTLRLPDRRLRLLATEPPRHIGSVEQDYVGDYIIRRRTSSIISGPSVDNSVSIIAVDNIWAWTTVNVWTNRRHLLDEETTEVINCIRRLSYLLCNRPPVADLLTVIFKFSWSRPLRCHSICPILVLLSYQNLAILLVCLCVMHLCLSLIEFFGTHCQHLVSSCFICLLKWSFITKNAI